MSETFSIHSSLTRSHHCKASIDPIPAMWFALCIGNTRSHWAYIERHQIRATWDAPHLSPDAAIAEVLRDVYDRPVAVGHAESPMWRSASASATATSATATSATQPQMVATATSSTASTSTTSATTSTTALHVAQANTAPIPITIASVVPQQTQRWQTGLDRLTHPYRILELSDIPLMGLYPTLGIDRALAGLGVGLRCGFPCLTIDGGTALTFTGFARYSPTEVASGAVGGALGGASGEMLTTPIAQGSLVGGAILPGMGLQYYSLKQQAAQLSEVVMPFNLKDSVRPHPTDRWARDTRQAIDSGIHRAIGAIAWDFILDWWRRYPGAIVAITGGDATAIEAAITQHVLERDGRQLSAAEQLRISVTPEAIIWGTIAALRHLLRSGDTVAFRHCDRRRSIAP